MCSKTGKSIAPLADDCQGFYGWRAVVAFGSSQFWFFCFFCFRFFGRSRDNQQPFLTHTPTNCTNNGEESNEEEFDEKEEFNEEEGFNEEEKLGEEEVKRVFVACVQDFNGILVGQDPLFSLEIAL